jgi:quercetin dioxygenase-like cupin family protein
MTTPYTLFNLPVQLPTLESDSILSRTIYNDNQVKAVLFTFAAGQELSEHTASMPAIIHILKGEGSLTLGTDTVEAHEGTWARMEANLPHSVKAKTALAMLLLMLKKRIGNSNPQPPANGKRWARTRQVPLCANLHRAIAK